MLSDYCNKCKVKCRAKEDSYAGSGTAKRRVYQKGQFAIQCGGYPESYRHMIREHLGTQFLELTPEEQELAIGIYDPVAWAKQNLNWLPRGATPENMIKYSLTEGAEMYQSLLLRCTAKRRVMRIGRRAGKTELIVIKILHSLFTNKNFKVLVVTPFKAQVELIFKRMNQLLEGNPSLLNAIVRNVASPPFQLELSNGAHVLGFSSGSKSGGKSEGNRRQAADMIVLDEMDYLGEEDLTAILALLTDHANVTLWASSTPTGKRSHFYNFCHNPLFKSYHFPSMANPNWNDDMEIELRSLLVDDPLGYEHEALAEFGEELSGVFNHQFVDLAIANYDYNTQKRDSNWFYTIGVDWNPIVGTEVLVLGAREDNGSVKFRIVDSLTVSKGEWTSTRANQAVVEMNKKWEPHHI